LDVCQLREVLQSVEDAKNCATALLIPLKELFPDTALPTTTQVAQAQEQCNRKLASIEEQKGQCAMDLQQRQEALLPAVESASQSFQKATRAVCAHNEEAERVIARAQQNSAEFEKTIAALSSQ
jgi:cyclopropane fatty-acyl-phospholipid synthase-like methyltransferase